MGCKGESCEHCFLKDFCVDLDALLSEGSLPGRGEPPCLGGGAAPAPFRFGKKKEIFEFAQFYIDSRYFLKGSSCRGCAHEKGCAGLGVKKIREKGFSAMRKVKA